MYRRISVVASLALSAGVLALAAPGAFADGESLDNDAGDGWAGDATWLGGQSTYDFEAGEWIHTDFVYDDYGANTCSCGQPNVVSLGGTTGDYRYPDGDEFRDNAADIVEVRARIADNGEDLEVRVLLSTLVSADVPALYVSATDGDTTLLDTVVTAHTAGVVIDETDNTITFAIPGGAAPFTIDLVVGAGLHDGSGGLRAGVTGTAHLTPGEITTGGPATSDPVAGRLFDLAFNTADDEGRGGPWNEDAQSAALAAGNLETMSQTVSPAVLRGDAVHLHQGLQSGYHIGILQSRQDLGEGMAGSFPQYRSQYQPYALWIPQGYSDRSASVPFYLSMHSLSSFHNQYRGGSNPGATYATYYEQLGDDIGAIVATPLSRGPDGWYEAEALIDTLEVWADVLARFDVDRERVYAGGYSMGGYGTYKLTTMMPDAFASAAVVVGPPTNGIWAYPLAPEADGREDRPDNTYWQLESTRHVPTSIKHGTNDELVPVTGIVHQAQRYEELGHEYRFNLFPGHDHLSFAVADGWAEEASWLTEHPTRAVDPNRVTLDIRPSAWVEGAAGREGAIRDLLFDLVDEVGADVTGGYWVDDVVLADETGDATGVIDLVSGGIALAEADGGLVTGADVSPQLGAYAITGFIKTTETVETEDIIGGALRNVAALTIDLERAGVSDDVTIDVDTDGPVTITLVRGDEFVDVVTLG